MGTLKSNFEGLVGRLCGAEEHHDSMAAQVHTRQPLPRMTDRADRADRADRVNRARDLYLKESPISFTVNGDPITCKLTMDA